MKLYISTYLLLVFIFSTSFSQQLKLVKACNNNVEKIDTVLAVNDHLYFTIGDNKKKTLWVTDGNQNSTEEVASSLNIRIMATQNDKLYYTSAESDSISLCVTKGKIGTTQKLLKFRSIFGKSDTVGIELIGTVGSKMYFFVLKSTDSISNHPGTNSESR